LPAQYLPPDSEAQDPQGASPPERAVARPAPAALFGRGGEGGWGRGVVRK